MNEDPIQKIIEAALGCDDKVEVRQVAAVFMKTIDVMVNSDGTFDLIAKSLGDDFTTKLLGTLIGSFLSSIYAVNRIKSEEDAIAFAKSLGIADVKSVSEKEKKENQA